MKKALLLTLFSISLAFYGQNSDFIHVDQFGYLPQQNKVAVLSNPQVGYNSSFSYTAPESIEVRNTNTNAIVLEVSPVSWNNNATHNPSGDKGWWVDFSEITASGSYYLHDPINNISSGTFLINQAVYTNVMRIAGKMFYYNRCNASKEEPYAEGWEDTSNFNNPLQDFNARYIYDQSNESLEKDLSGGWFDAGDYNKYVTFTHSTLHDLLSAFQENPQAFSDAWNIPESNNGIPDIIDEIKWELDWLLKMMNPDGSVHIKMGNRNYNENISSPPSANTDGRYYGPVCTSASISVASVFAHASIVFSEIPTLASYGEMLLQKAIIAYQYAKPFVISNTLQTNCDDGSIVSGDADRTSDQQKVNFLTAAIYLFGITGEQEYQEYSIANIPNTDGVNYYWGPYTISQNDALLYYTTLAQADTATKNLILNRFESTINADGLDYFGFNTKDLYRANIPTNSYHWGSNSIKASYGNLNTLAITANVTPNLNDDFLSYIDESIHYFHGVNPQSTVYLSNMYAYGAEKSVNEIYHSWFANGTVYDHAITSPIGPAPGFLVGGPNQFYSVPEMSPPSGQPALKSYLDFNDDTSTTRSWEITEPAIYYQAAYIRLLANNVDASEILTNESFNKPLKQITLIPNPANNYVKIPEANSNDILIIYNVLGQRLKEINLKNNTLFYVGELNSGIYFVTLKALDNTISETQKLIVY